MSDTYFEWRAGVTGPGWEVEGNDEVNSSLWPQNDRIGQVKGKTTVHHVDFLTLHI